MRLNAATETATKQRTFARDRKVAFCGGWLSRLTPVAYLFLRPGVSAAVGDFDNTMLRKEVPYEIVDAGRQRFSLT